MMCPENEEKLVLYLHDELSALERSGFERHLNECDACRSELSAYKLIEQGILKGDPEREGQHDEHEEGSPGSKTVEKDASAGLGNAELENREFIAAGGDLGRMEEANALVDAYIEHGLRRLNAGDVDQAILDFAEAIRGNPHSLPAYLNRAIARKVLGDNLRRQTLLDEARNVWLAAQRDLQRVLELASPGCSEGIRAKALMVEVQKLLSNP